MKTIEKIGIVVCSVIPLALLCYAVYRYGLDIPYSDQWHLIPLLEKQQQGTLSLTDLLAQHNEHRIVVPRMLFLFFASLSGWNIRIELAANILTAIVTMGLMTLAVYRMFRTAGKPTPPWSIPLLSVIMFSLAQWQNWLWGWQLQIFLSILFTLIGFFLLTTKHLSWHRIVTAFLCGGVAISSFGTGLIFFPICVWLLWIRSDIQRNARIGAIALWVIGSLLLYQVFFLDYYHPPASPPLFLSRDLLLSFIGYVFAYLGTPVGGFSLYSAIPAGMLGLTTFMYLFFRLRSFQRPVSFFVALGMFACLSALITATSRGFFGIEQALSSRYVTIAQLLWIANIFMILFALKVKQHTAPVRQQVAAAVLVLLLIVAISITSLRSLTEFAQMHQFLTGAKDTLLLGVHPYRWQRLNPDPLLVEQGTPILKRYNLSLFRVK